MEIFFFLNDLQFVYVSVFHMYANLQEDTLW